MKSRLGVRVVLSLLACSLLLAGRPPAIAASISIAEQQQLRQQQQQQQNQRQLGVGATMVEIESRVWKHQRSKQRIGPAGSTTATMQQTSIASPSGSNVNLNGQSVPAGSLAGTGAPGASSPPTASAGDLSGPMSGGVSNSNAALLNGKAASGLPPGVVTEPNNILNSGTSRMHTDRDGHHYIYMVNNNVLTQSVPTASSQIMAAAAAQAIARHIVDMNLQRQDLEQETSEEEGSKGQQIQKALSESKAAAAKTMAAISGSQSGSQPGSQAGSPAGSQSGSSGGSAAAALPETEDALKRAAAQRQRLVVTLHDPWKNYGGEYGDAAATRVDKLCMVSGMVAGSSGLVATLGPDCRPAGGRVVFALMRGDMVSRVDVLPDGRIYVIAGGNDGWLSLSGISFVVGVDAEVELLSKWVDYGNGYRATSISKISDMCILSGLIRSGDWGKPFGRTAQECYPNQRLVFSLDNHESVARVDLVTSGHFVWAAGARSHGWISLDGLLWCVADGGINLNLASGWLNYGGEYRAARYCMVRDMCIVSGLVRNDDDWAKNPTITVLPPPCRPKTREVFSVSVNINGARLDVFPNGKVTYQSGKMNWPWLSLEGLRFVVANLGASVSGGDIAATGASSAAGVQSAAAAIVGTPGKAVTSPSAKPSFRSKRFKSLRS